MGHKRDFTCILGLAILCWYIRGDSCVLLQWSLQVLVFGLWRLAGSMTVSTPTNSSFNLFLHCSLKCGCIQGLIANWQFAKWLADWRWSKSYAWPKLVMLWMWLCFFGVIHSPTVWAECVWILFTLKWIPSSFCAWIYGFMVVVMPWVISNAIPRCIIPWCGQTSTYYFLVLPMKFF